MSLRSPTSSSEMSRLAGKASSERVFEDLEALLDRKAEKMDKSDKVPTPELIHMWPYKLTGHSCLSKCLLEMR